MGSCMSSNRLTRILSKINQLPAALHGPALSLLFGSPVKFAGTARVRVHELTQQRAVMSLANKRKVQNHIKGVHAAMALLAESATELLLGMNVPDDKLPLIKSLKVDYLRRAEASLTPEQIRAIHSQAKGEVLVAVQVTDESGNRPIQCEMLWAWVSKKR